MIEELREEAVVGGAFLSVIPRRHGYGRNGAAQHRGGGGDVSKRGEEDWVRVGVGVRPDLTAGLNPHRSLTGETAF